MVDRPAEAPGGLRCEIGSQWRYRFVVVAGIVGELDGDRLGRALRYGAIQLVDRPLGLDALIEPNEANALRQACRAGSKVANGTYKVIIWLLRTDGARRVVSHVRSRGALLEIPFLVSFLDLLSCSFSFSRETGSIAMRRISRERPGSPDSGMTHSLGKHVGHSRLLGAMLPFDSYVPSFVRIRDHVIAELSTEFPGFLSSFAMRDHASARSLGYIRHFALILFPRSMYDSTRE